MPQTQTATVWTYRAEEFVHWLFNLSRATATWLNTMPERADTPTVSKWGGENKLDSKATMVSWHSKDLFLWDTSLHAHKCRLPLASGNKQNKCCSSENTDVLHHFDILLTDSLLPKSALSCLLSCGSPYFFYTPFSMCNKTVKSAVWLFFKYST